jgi:putative NADH-flavin reductase
MEEKKIGIFPASGSLGGSVVKHLSSLIPASSLILIARRPDTLAEYSRQGAVIRRADYDEDSSLNRAFDGVGVLFLISYASCEHEHRSKVSIHHPHFFKIRLMILDRHTVKQSMPLSTAA